MSSRSQALRRANPLALIAAIVALVSQLALGAMVLPDRTQAAEIGAVGVLCHSHAPGHRTPPRSHRGAADPALCPLAFALALPSVLPAASAMLPPPLRSVAIARPALRPAARAPPTQALRTGAPRGPPVLV